MRSGAILKDGVNATLAGFFTLATFAGLPLAHNLGHGGVPDVKVFEIGVAEPPPPPPPPLSLRLRERKAITKRVEKLTLTKQRTMIPLQAALHLDLSLGDVVGDFALDFGVSEPRIEPGPEYKSFGISEIDTSPRAISRVNPLYPVLARMRKVEGHVQVEFIVGRDGKVSGVEITDSSPEGVFDAAALQAVRRWRFKSGTKGGQPVPVRVRQTMQFNLEQ